MNDTSYSKLRNIKCIISDFDDTFMRGSEGMKRDAWKDLFISDVLYSRYTEAQLEVSNGNKGGRRYIVSYTLGLPENDPQVLAYEKRFDEIVQEKIISIGIAGADLNTLESLKAQGYLVYLMSGTPEEALLRTLHSLDRRHDTKILKMFDLVLGQPKNKVENFAVVQEHAKAPYDQMVKIGDSMADFNAAMTVGAYFIGVTTPSNKDIWAAETFPKVNSFSEIISVLNKAS